MGVVFGPFQIARTACSDQSHVLWVLLQQLLVRGVVAVKFLLVARLLGPEAIGLVGVALLAIAIAEGLSDTGLPQALVQSSSTIDRLQAGAVWTLQAVRGIFLASLLGASATAIAWLFNAPGSEGLVALAAPIVLLRNGVNPGIYLAQRQRNFRAVALCESLAATVDLIVTLTSVSAGCGAASVLIGTIACETTKFVQTWTLFRFPLRLSLEWSGLRQYTSFGKWVWGSSALTVVLNQMDKVLVARLLGVSDFGLYQLASRIAQLVVADGATAFGHYLFPTFAHKHRQSSAEARAYFAWIMRWFIPLIAALAIGLAMAAHVLIGNVFGEEWMGSVDLLRVLSIAMFFGAVNAVLVAFSRSIGSPGRVTCAVAVQLVVLSIAAPFLILSLELSALGMAIASALALGLSSIVLGRGARLRES